MKRIIFSLIAVLMFLAFYPVKASAETNDTKKEIAVEATAQEQADIMIDRIYEIMEMNIKSLDGPEKEKLRNEVMSIKDKLQQLNGIYISAGALIIIIILLILL